MSQPNSDSELDDNSNDGYKANSDDDSDDDFADRNDFLAQIGLGGSISENAVEEEDEAAAAAEEGEEEEESESSSGEEDEEEPGKRARGRPKGSGKTIYDIQIHKAPDTASAKKWRLNLKPAGLRKVGNNHDRTIWRCKEKNCWWQVAAYKTACGGVSFRVSSDNPQHSGIPEEVLLDDAGIPSVWLEFIDLRFEAGLTPSQVKSAIVDKVADPNCTDQMKMTWNTTKDTKNWLYMLQNRRRSFMKARDKEFRMETVQDVMNYLECKGRVSSKASEC